MSSKDPVGETGLGKPIYISDDQFEETVLQAETPVVVDFYASWCGPCRNIAPSLDRLAKEFAGKVVVAKVDIDKNRQWARKYGIQAIPSLVFVHRGKIVKRTTGGLSAGKLQGEFEVFLKETEAATPTDQK
jgi:thioredoxin 1